MMNVSWLPPLLFLLLLLVLPANPCINTPLLQDTPAHRTLLLLLVLLLAGVSTPASPRPSSCSSFKPLCILVINTGDPYQ